MRASHRVWSRRPRPSARASRPSAPPTSLPVTASRACLQDRPRNPNRRDENLIRMDELVSPLLRHKHPEQPSVFAPDALMRGARRQRRLPEQPAPALCVLDPDGDILRCLSGRGRRTRSRPGPATTRRCSCSSSTAARSASSAARSGPYAVLVAERMSAAGCELLLSVTSAGLTDVGPTPYFVVLDRALRDEGTSHHYLPAADFAAADFDPSPEPAAR